MSDVLDVLSTQRLKGQNLIFPADGALMLKKMEQHSSNFIFLLGEGSTVQASGAEI